MDGQFQISPLRVVTCFSLIRLCVGQRFVLATVLVAGFLLPDPSVAQTTECTTGINLQIQTGPVGPGQHVEILAAVGRTCITYGGSFGDSHGDNEYLGIDGPVELWEGHTLLEIAEFNPGGSCQVLVDPDPTVPRITSCGRYADFTVTAELQPRTFHAVHRDSGCDPECVSNTVTVRAQSGIPVFSGIGAVLLGAGLAAGGAWGLRRRIGKSRKESR